MQSAATIEDVEDYRKATASLFVVRDVEYRPKWSVEVEAVMEADPDNLPADMSPRSLKFLGTLRGILEGKPASGGVHS